MIRITANVYYEDMEVPTVDSCLDELYYISTLIDDLLGTNKCWYEKDYSRKQALEQIVFNHKKAESAIIEKWRNKIKKDHPLIIDGVWDGESDNKICSLNYIKKHYENPKKIMLDISMTCSETDVNPERVVEFMKSLIINKPHAYATISTNGYWNNAENIFPDRICAGWMIYIPAKILPELIPEAVNIVPVVVSEKHIGTIVISTGDVFDGRNNQHICKANGIEIKLLDLGLLPLMTEL